MWAGRAVFWPWETAEEQPAAEGQPAAKAEIIVLEDGVYVIDRAAMGVSTEIDPELKALADAVLRDGRS